MKPILFGTLFTLLFPALVKASPPFKYHTNCYLEHSGKFYEDVCTVIEIREKTGALKSRNIFSNRFSLTIKSHFDPKKGFVTWDSFNRREYQWTYKNGSVDNTPATYVMPGILLESVSWD